jgi:hypothetical protein
MTEKQQEVYFPITPKMLISILEPKDFDHELTETFEYVYVNWAVPELGYRRAYIWAWGQVLRTATKLLVRLALDVLDRIYYRRAD